MVIVILVKTHVHVNHNNVLHGLPTGFPESPQENILIVNSDNTSGLNPATSHHGKLSEINLERNLEASLLLSPLKLEQALSRKLPLPDLGSSLAPIGFPESF